MRSAFFKVLIIQEDVNCDASWNAIAKLDSSHFRSRWINFLLTLIIISLYSWLKFMKSLSFYDMRLDYCGQCFDGNIWWGCITGWPLRWQLWRGRGATTSSVISGRWGSLPSSLQNCSLLCLTSIPWGRTCFDKKLMGTAVNVAVLEFNVLVCTIYVFKWNLWFYSFKYITFPDLY